MVIPACTTTQGKLKFAGNLFYHQDDILTFWRWLHFLKDENGARQLGLCIVLVSYISLDLTNRLGSYHAEAANSQHSLILN